MGKVSKKKKKSMESWKRIKQIIIIMKFFPLN